MGYFVTKLSDDKPNVVNYKNTLTALAAWLSKNHGKEFVYGSSVDETAKSLDVVYLTITETESGQKVLNLKKNLRPDNLYPYFSDNNYFGLVDEFKKDMQDLFHAIPNLEELKDYFKLLIEDYNKSGESLDYIIKRALNPMDIRLSEVFVYDPKTKEKTKVKKSRLFEFLATFISAVRESEYKVSESYSKPPKFNSLGYGKDDNIYRTYSIVNGDKPVLSSTALSSYNTYFSGLVVSAEQNLDSYISLDEALDIIENFKTECPYMEVFKEMFRNFDKEEKDYTVGELFDLYKVQQDNFGKK